MIIRKYSPRFIAIGHAAQYGSRDEITGYRKEVLATAETEGWLNHLLKPYEAWEENSEFYIRVVETEPEKAPENWGPKLPRWGFITETGALEVEELPF